VPASTVTVVCSRDTKRDIAESRDENFLVPDSESADLALVGTVPHEVNDVQSIDIACT
jgi:hypothetical protein